MTIRKKLFILVCLYSLPFTMIDCKEFQYLIRSPKALLMGDAYTAVADDAYTLFYNPAALGRNQGLSVYFINPDIGVTNVLREVDRFENFPERDPVAISDRVLGLPFYLRAGATPGLKMEHFGLSFFAGVKTNLILRNAVHPTLSADYDYDRGFVAGYAFTFGHGGRGKSKKSTAGRRTSIGVAVKQMNRQGIHQQFDLFGLSLLNKITSSENTDMVAIRRSLGYSQGNALGGDVGIEHNWTTNYSQWNLGFSVLDLFGTHFRRTSGTGKVPAQPTSMNLGTAWSQDFFLFHYTLSADVHPINSTMEWKRKFHFGVQLGIPFVSILAGWNGGYVSYGASIELWPITLYGGFYGVELGNKYLEDPGERALIYVSLLDFSFDA